MLHICHAHFMSCNGKLKRSHAQITKVLFNRCIQYFPYHNKSCKIERCFGNSSCYLHRKNGICSCTSEVSLFKNQTINLGATNLQTGVLATKECHFLSLLIRTYDLLLTSAMYVCCMRTTFISHLHSCKYVHTILL